MWGKRREAQTEKAAGGPAQPAAGASVAAAVTEALVQNGRAAPRGPEPQQTPAAEAPINGAAVQSLPALDEKAQAFWRGKLATANFGGAISLFMRSPAHRNYTLADLEWALIPALALNQFMIAEAKLQDGQAIPVALVLWARVSAEVDARLSAAPRYPIRLHPNEWQSGDIIWIVDAVGDPKAVQQGIEALAKTAFQGKQFKMLKLETTT
jgi:hemolysin-activating ACP:hemolysin acyltransferase